MVRQFDNRGHIVHEAIDVLLRLSHMPLINFIGLVNQIVRLESVYAETLNDVVDFCPENIDKRRQLKKIRRYSTYTAELVGDLLAFG